MDDLWSYILCLLFTTWGFVLFSWWWRKTGKATAVYKYITILFLAETIEKSIFVWIRYNRYYGNWDLYDFINVSTSWYWSYVSLPTTIAFGVIVTAMTARIITTHRSAKRDPGKVRAPNVDRSALVVSSYEETRLFFSGTFVANDVRYLEATDLVQGFDLLVTNNDVSVVIIGLSAVENAGVKAIDVVESIRRENPWCVVVALSRTPTRYELFEARRAHFDDYLYLPIEPEKLMATFERWLAKVTRWKTMGGNEWRLRRAVLFNRSQKCDDCPSKEVHR